jgi:MoxR-like ATPase
VPFLLLATQNPIDFEGTYVLPEAQLDRFMMKFSLGYPSEEAENRMVMVHSRVSPLDAIEPVTTVEAVAEMQQMVRDLHMDPAVGEYAVHIVRKTREHPAVYLGASPRATIALIQAAKAYAFLNERDYVVPDDIKYLVPHVLGHRILLHTNARLEGATVPTVLESVLQTVRVPVRLER